MREGLGLGAERDKAWSKWGCGQAELKKHVHICVCVCVCVCVYLYMTCLSGARYSQTQNHLGAQRGTSGGRREGDG